MREQTTNNPEPQDQSSAQALTLVERALDSVCAVAPPQTSVRFKSIIYTNHERDRIIKFTNGDPAKIQTYIQETFERFQQLSGYLRSIQVERDEALWEPLFEKMTKWAYRALLRHNFKPGSHTSDLAHECASEAAIKLLNSHFPYDTNFDSWAHVLTYFTCLKFFRQGSKKTNPANAAPLDEAINLPAESDGLTPEERASRRIDLLDAISQLAPSRQMVIRLTYFEGMDAEQAAEVMSRSRGAVYNLRYNALNELREILDNQWDN